jgi:beta-glucosidase
MLHLGIVALALACPAFTQSAVGDWDASYGKAVAALDQLSTDEMLSIIIGASGPCGGNLAGVPSIGFPAMCLQDGPIGCENTIYKMNSLNKTGG